MPRDLPVGNGQMLVAFDHCYQLRELFYPHVGQYNHTLGHAFRFGVWSDGQLCWIDGPGWRRSLNYEHDTLVTLVELEHDEMGLKLTCRDCVDLDAALLVRRIDVENCRAEEREVVLFFHHDFNIHGSSEGDTACYHPVERALLHYKGSSWFLASGMTKHAWGLSSFATGIKRHHGADGTWRDAEDGALECNPIAQGSVDSTGALRVVVGNRATAYYWIGAGQRMEDVLEVNRRLRDQHPESVVRRVRAFWKQWVCHDSPESRLPARMREFFRRSLLILRTQIDNGGAILAANDSDTLGYNRDSYSYLWPRDGALVAEALDLAGHHDVAARFFEHCARLITREGYFMHKYNPDGSVGSSWHPWCGPDGVLQLPIQEDETALVLMALWNHFEASRDIDFIRTLYRPLVERAADFLCAFRDPELGLPAESWDLWEERRGIHLFTVASVWAGLRAASNFAEMFGDSIRAERCADTAAEIRRATEVHLYDPERGRFLRSLSRNSHGWQSDGTLDSSQSGIFLFGMFGAMDPRVTRTMQAIEESLWCRTAVGGVARYERDPYYRMAENTDEVPGNPWFLSTLWLAQWYIECAQSPEDLVRPLELLDWVTRHALPSGVLAEQLHPFSGAPLSVSPLTWSHATFVNVVCRWEAKHHRLTDRRVRPATATGRARRLHIPLVRIA